MLALGATLDASVVQVLREAAPLGDLNGLLERGQRGVLQPGVRPCVCQRHEEADIVGRFIPRAVNSASPSSVDHLEQVSAEHLAGELRIAAPELDRAALQPCRQRGLVVVGGGLGELVIAVAEDLRREIVVWLERIERSSGCP